MSLALAALAVAAVAPAVAIVPVVAVAVVAAEPAVDGKSASAMDIDAGEGRKPAIAPMLGRSGGG
jgi:hypothetical protein